jgi:hypothetical protein
MAIQVYQGSSTTKRTVQGTFPEPHLWYFTHDGEDLLQGGLRSQVEALAAARGVNLDEDEGEEEDSSIPDEVA